jgi:hypothetical protein
MMFKYILVIACLALITTAGKSKKNLKVDIDEAGRIFSAFMDGCGLRTYLVNAVDCEQSTSYTYSNIANAVNSFNEEERFEGVISVTEGLAGLSFLTRKCFAAQDQFRHDVIDYFDRFDRSWVEFTQQVSLNTLGHLSYL